MDPKYLRWLLYSVLIECKTTLWCANTINADPKQVLIDFNTALRNYDKLRPINPESPPKNQ